MIGCADEQPSLPPSPEQLADAIYTGIYDEPVATGEIDGTSGAEAAVLLAENSGGSGSFVYLAVVGLQDGKPVNLGTALVGDRSQVQTISIEGSRIRLELLEHGPLDPACCPSSPASQIWVLRDGHLTRIAENDAEF